MTPFALLKIAKALAGKETLTLPEFFYATLAFEGAEISGVTREAVLYDDPVQTSDTVIEWDNKTAVGFDNTPGGEADEVWILDASVGGNVWDKIPIDGAPITLTDGGNKTFPAHSLSHDFTNATV